VNSSLKEFQNIASKLIFFPEPNLRWFLSVWMEISRRGDKCPGIQQPAVLDSCMHGQSSTRTLFLRILQAGPVFFIEIKCSALNLKYLSQYLNGFGCPLVPLNFQNLIFGL